jgi:hypothetical protein
MVERFLYGLDDDIEKQVAQFCKQTVPDIHKQLLEKVEFDNKGDGQKSARG